MITLFPCLVQLRCLYQARRERYRVYLCCYWGVCTKQGQKVIMYICVVIEVSVPSQERELSCLSFLSWYRHLNNNTDIHDNSLSWLGTDTSITTQIYMIPLFPGLGYWGVCTKPGKRVIMYICVVIEMSLPSQERELSCISLLLLKCMYHARKESYHVYLCCYWDVFTKPGKKVIMYHDNSLSWLGTYTSITTQIYLLTLFPGLVQTLQ
jgi:hypothetical protein